MDLSDPKTVLCVIGTRPEAIKMAPVVHALRRAPWCRCRVLVTAQHREMLDQMLAFFRIAPDRDLEVMRPQQSLAELTARLLTGLDEALQEEQPDLVLTQGDTTTVLATALACFYRRIPVGHVEAGLRSGNLEGPFPEEANRVLVGRLADLHLAPTAGARDNLLREGVAPERIVVTGNTVIDALYLAAREEAPIGISLDPGRRLVLVTAHRRDNHGEPMARICRALLQLVNRFPDIEVLWPVHPHPAVWELVHAMLGEQPRVHLCGSLAYGSLVTALRRAYLVLTDSGGIMEEASSLGKPVLVLRDETERPEIIDLGLGKLVGTQEELLLAEAGRLLSDEQAHAAMSVGSTVFGDGTAAQTIVEACRRFLQVGDESIQQTALEGLALAISSRRHDFGQPRVATDWTNRS